MHHAGIVVVALLFLLGVLAVGPNVAALALLAALGVLAALALALGLLDHVSIDARAERAERAGRIGEALRLYARQGSHQQIEQLLWRLPVRCADARRALVAATSELSELQEAIARARAIDVAGPLVDSIAAEARVAAEALWRAADRLSAAVTWSNDSERIQQGLSGEIARLEQIATALRAARTGLIELILLDTEPPGATPAAESAVIRLRALGDAARELASTDEPWQRPR